MNKKENIYGKYNHIFTDEINSLFIDRRSFQEETFDVLSDEGMCGLKLRSVLVHYFECSNGYAGFDLSVIRYDSYHIIFWYKILTLANASDFEKDVACAEIQMFFYHWIGAVYGLKEKLLSFVGGKVDKSRIVFGETCLSEKGKSAVVELFSKYKELIPIFNIRNMVIHDTYDLQMERGRSEIEVADFGFKLVPGPCRNRPPYPYDISGDNIAGRFNDASNLLDDYICLLMSIENVSTSSFSRKFVDADGRISMGL